MVLFGGKCLLLSKTKDARLLALLEYRDDTQRCFHVENFQIAFAASEVMKTTITYVVLLNVN